MLQRIGELIEAQGATYRWRWSPATDEVRLEDADGRLVLTCPLQPVVATVGGETRGASGSVTAIEVDGSRLHVRYRGVNGAGGIELALRFLPEYFVLDAVTYERAGDEDIVAIDYFSSWADGSAEPGAAVDTCVIPGGRQDPEQAIFRTAGLESVRFSIGCFGMGTGTFHQQWALPHYLVACYNRGDGPEPASGAACIGLGGVPDGNVSVIVNRGRFCYEVNLRGDLWGHRRERRTSFDFPLVTAVATDWYRAGQTYFQALAAEGYAEAKQPDEIPAPAYWPQYDTWGDQAARRCILHLFDEAHLRAIYQDFRASGLRARIFVIDDKWEGVYGSLEYDRERFPHFLELLDEIRADGYGIGLWTAFPRCEDYRALGLSEADVLVRPDGTPYLERQGDRSWHVFDPTSPRAAAYLAGRARHLVRSYRPALVKIDFGYEIPTPDVAGPHDPSQGGERLFLRFLEVIVGALKEADPNVAVLYYCLSPLFNQYIDQCGMDDLWMSRGAYDRGFAKRALLSSWCGAFGMVPYGSSGYDWRSIAEIWFDTAVIGTPGVIAPLAGDEYGQRPTPELIARYNGIARVARSNPLYRVELLDAELHDPAAGPRARSWLRVEGEAAVVTAIRPQPGSTAKVPELMEADCRVVVASLTAEDIRTAARIGIVPFGPGRLRVHRTRDGRADAVAHLLGGETLPLPVRQESDALTIEVVDVSPDGQPVELIEVSFA